MLHPTSDARTPLLHGGQRSRPISISSRLMGTTILLLGRWCSVGVTSFVICTSSSSASSVNTGVVGSLLALTVPFAEGGVAGIVDTTRNVRRAAVHPVMYGGVVHCLRDVFDRLCFHRGVAASFCVASSVTAATAAATAASVPAHRVQSLLISLILYLLDLLFFFLGDMVAAALDAVSSGAITTTSVIDDPVFATAVVIAAKAADVVDVFIGIAVVLFIVDAVVIVGIVDVAGASCVPLIARGSDRARVSSTSGPLSPRHRWPTFPPLHCSPPPAPASYLAASTFSRAPLGNTVTLSSSVSSA